MENISIVLEQSGQRISRSHKIHLVPFFSKFDFQQTLGYILVKGKSLPTSEQGGRKVQDGYQI